MTVTSRGFDQQLLMLLSSGIAPHTPLPPTSRRPWPLRTSSQLPRPRLW